MDWLDLLAVQGTLKSLLQHHSSEASILLCSAFFMVQLSYPYMTTGKTIALTIHTFVGKLMSLLFNMLSRLVIAFLRRSKWFHFKAVVTICSDFGVQENKVCHCFHCFLIGCHEVMELDAMILVFWMLSFKPAFSLSSFTFVKRLLSSSSLFAIRVLSAAYLGCWFSPGNLDSSLCFVQSGILHDVLCILKLNKQSDHVQPWSTFFPIWNHSVVPCLVLTVASSPAYRLLRRQGVWYSHFFQNFPQFVVIHTVKVFGIVSEAEVDVFLEFSCFFDDPKDVGNLHLEVRSSCIVEASLGEFWELFC